MTNGSARQDDWVTQLLDKLDEAIEFVRSKTTEPVAKVARYLVYVILFMVLGLTLLTLSLITFVRVLGIIPGPIWWAYGGAAVVTTILGTFFWRKAIKATR
jgi:hypothetical protein